MNSELIKVVALVVLVVVVVGIMIMCRRRFNYEVGKELNFSSVPPMLHVPRTLEKGFPAQCKFVTRGAPSKQTAIVLELDRQGNPTRVRYLNSRGTETHGPVLRVVGKVVTIRHGAKGNPEFTRLLIPTSQF